MLCLQAGRLLAQLLMQGGHGDRPVTLIGYSMGARLVFHCLLELARSNCKGAVLLEGYSVVSHSLGLECGIRRPTTWQPTAAFYKADGW